MRVLIAYDGSAFAETAIADLVYAGLPANTDARIFHALERPSDLLAEALSGDWSVLVHNGPAPVSEDVCARLQRRFPAWNIQIETAIGSPASMIIKRAKEWHADLVVLGTHGRSAVGRVVLGSVSSAVARDADCSVRIVRRMDQRSDGVLRLLVGHDGSPEADRAVAAVCNRVWPAGTEVRIVSVIEELVATRADKMAGIANTVSDINAEEHHWLEYLTGEAQQKCIQAGLAASTLVTDGDPKQTLIQEARRWNADTIFIGATGIGLVERLLLGGVSLSVIAHAPCTVEVVRAN